MSHKFIARGFWVWMALLVSVGLACGGGGGEGTGGSSAASSSGSTSGITSSSSGSMCSAATCTGCCFNGVCQPGDTNAGCGKNGEACAACGGSTVCKADQTCGVDPNSMWEIQPTSGSISMMNGGSAWDPGGGAPDAIVTLYCPATMMNGISTPSATDTFNPTWNSGSCTMSAMDLMTIGVGVEVNDDDPIPPNDKIASKATIKATEAALVAGAITGITNNTTLLSLTLKLTKK